MTTNQIILTGTTASELVELFRPMVHEEVKQLMSQQPERLLSPAETCKLFQPCISKVTLAAWTKKDLLTEHRIGGRVFYKQSEILQKVTILKRYKN